MQIITKILQKEKLDALLIIQKDNIGYLTGFWGSFGVVAISRKKITLFTDSRYLLEAKEVIFPNINLEDYHNLKKFLKNKNKVGYEGEHMTVSQLKNWQKKFSEKSFRITRNIIETLRNQKEKQEIQKTQKAANISDNILKDIKSKIKIGITEKDLKWEIRKIAADLGTEEMAFDTTVCFGKNSAKPHHTANLTKLKKGDLVLLDLGAKSEKYCSDITRVFFTKPPSTQETNIFNIVLESQQKAIQEIKKTKTCSKIDQIARDYIKQAGFGEYFQHSLGHGVGLQIHESPSLSPFSKEKLQENNIFTIEPGIYLPGKFGIRLEDLFLCKKNSLTQLSQFTKDINELILRF